MKKEIRVYLDDIRESIEKIEKYTHGITFEKFSNNTESQDAVIRRLEIIGEAVKRLPDNVKMLYSDIPWKQISGMRDILIHEYAGVSLERVWKVIQKDLIPLKKVALDILEKL